MKDFKSGDTRFQLVGKYKLKSIFVRIMVFLLLYSALILAVLFFYNRLIIRRNVEQRLELRTLGLLEKTQESIDRELYNLSGQITQLSKDEYIRSGMTAPNIKNSIRNYNIVYQLQTAQMINDLIARAFLYVPTDDTFFSGDGIAAGPGEREHVTKDVRQIVELCQKPFPAAGEQQLVTIGDTYYLLLYAPYFYDRVLGVLGFEINSQYLHRIVEGRSESGMENTIWIYDSGGNPVFPSQMNYPKELTPGELIRTEQTTFPGKSGVLAVGGRNVYYKVVSANNGWQYMLRKDTDLFQIEASVIDGGLLLIILVLVVFCVIFSVYLARSVYLPIRKLIGIAESGEEFDGAAARNELELLETNLSYTVMRNREMDHFLKNIRPAMISDTFRNLLLGHEIGREKLDAAFSALGGEFGTNQHYTLGIISIQPQEQEFSLLECNVLLQRVEQEILLFAKNRFLCSFVHMLESGSMVVVMGFSREISVNQLRNWQDELEPVLRELCSAWPVRLLTEMSRYFVEIEELYRSFSLINQSLNYKIYFQDQRERWERSESRMSVQSMIEQAYAVLKERIDNGEEDAARRQMDHTVAELLESEMDAGVMESGSGTGLAAFATLWWEAAMKQVLPLDVFEREELAGERARLLGATGSKETFAIQLEDFNDHIADKLKQSSYKMKRRYVERAKQYIEEHYSEPDLSLSGISEFLGISQSYLSTQFKKETGINFIEHLSRYRIERSKLLLQMTEMTVEEVGFKTGFSSAKNFNRVFKKYVECSPGVYRDNQRQPGTGMVTQKG